MPLGNMCANRLRKLATWGLGRDCNHHRDRELFLHYEPYPVSALCRMMAEP